MQPNAITFFAQFIQKELGIVYSEVNAYQLQSRLEEIVKLTGLKDIDALLEMAKTGLRSEIKQVILDVATNNETSFFRDPKMFAGLEAKVFPFLFDPGRKDTPRIWSAASSSGQEPYTLAMMAKTYCQNKGIPCNLEIMATDISSRILERAMKGRFGQLEVQRGLPTTLLVKHFSKDDENYWTISQDIRSMVRFKQLNLLEEFGDIGHFDLILCRNVLIYQDVPNKVKIISKMASRLRPGGHFVLGAGEGLIGLSQEFDSIQCDTAIIYKIKDKLLRTGS